MKKILVILGPTATGKTDLALSLAKKFNGEIISCDSRQVYKGLDIGTGKLPGGELRIKKQKKFWDMDGVRIWMYDVVSSQKQYTVADYVKEASGMIGDIRHRGKLPIVVGGTGLYLKALLYGLAHLSIPVNRKLRQELEQLSLDDLQKKLKQLSERRWENMNYSDQQNPRRLIRAIELEVGKGYRVDQENQALTKKLNILKIGLIAPRQILYQRADQGVVDRISMGMIEETKRLHQQGLSFKRMRQLGLEYGVLANYLEGKIRAILGDEGLIKIMQNKIHDFVRRQTTWFKKEKDVQWFNIDRKNFIKLVEKLVSEWYYS